MRALLSCRVPSSVPSLARHSEATVRRGRSRSDRISNNIITTIIIIIIVIITTTILISLPFMRGRALALGILQAPDAEERADLLENAVEEELLRFELQSSPRARD